MLIKFAFAQWPSQIYLTKWNNLLSNEFNHFRLLFGGGGVQIR